MVPIKYNLKSVAVRRLGTLMTILGIAMTAAVFVSILAMVTGLESTYIDTGDPLNLILIRQGAQAETNSFFDREIKGTVETSPGVQAAAGEIIVLVNQPRVSGDSANIMVRGISPQSLELRPKVKMSDGRLFKPGLRELVVSRSIAGRFKGTELGDSVKIGRANWSVVGIMDASRTAYDSEIWGDYNEISQEFDRPIYSSLLVRVTDSSALSPVKERLKGDQRLKLDVFTEKEYFETQTSSAAPLRYLGYFVGLIMAVGSCFSVMNTMYAATAHRTREIATLRVVGFKRRSILASFVLESILLGILGGIVGGGLAYFAIDGITTGTANWTSFSEIVFQFRVTPRLILTGIIFAVVMAGFGGFLPALSAAFRPIVRALRAEN